MEEQNEVIEMLEKLKERKRCADPSPQLNSILTTRRFRKQLAEFAERVGNISSSQVSAQASLQMEIDSTASTPA